MSDSCAMKVTFLGWWGAFPKSGEACSSVLIQTEEGSFLLDCGCGALPQYFKFAGIGELEGLLLSHLHFDHMSDTGSLLYAVNNGIRTGKRREKLVVYAPETPGALRAMLKYPQSLTKTLRAGMNITLAGVSVSVMPVKHTVECYAFRLERKGKTLVYFTDTEYLRDTGSFLRDADLFICEASITGGSTHTTGLGHMSDFEAGRLAGENRAKMLCLYHLPGDSDIDVMRNNAAAEFGGEVQTPVTQRVFYL